MGKPSSRNSLESILDFLSEHGDMTLTVAGTYTLDELTDDINQILDRQWSDGIDARGEDA